MPRTALQDKIGMVYSRIASDIKTTDYDFLETEVGLVLAQLGVVGHSGTVWNQLYVKSRFETVTKVLLTLVDRIYSEGLEDGEDLALQNFQHTEEEREALHEAITTFTAMGDGDGHHHLDEAWRKIITVNPIKRELDYDDKVEAIARHKFQSLTQDEFVQIMQQHVYDAGSDAEVIDRDYNELMTEVQ